MDQRQLKELIRDFMKNTSVKSANGLESVSIGNGYYYHYSSTKLKDIVEFILNDKKIGKYFNREKLLQVIPQRIGEGRAKDESNTQIETEVAQMVLASPKKYFCLIPIIGIKIDKEMDIGAITIYPASKKDFVLKANIKEEFLSKMHDVTGSDQDFATAIIESVMPEAANEKAVGLTLDALNIIRFLNDRPNQVFHIDVGVKNGSRRVSQVVAMSEEDGVIQHPEKFMPMEADLKDIRELPRAMNFIDRLTQIQSKSLDNKRLSPLEDGLFNAVNLIAVSFHTDELNLKILELMSSIEALVEEKLPDQGITDEVCERVASLIGKNPENRVYIYRRLKGLYNKRSKISHGNSVSTTYYDVMYLWEVAYTLCFFFVEHFDEFNDTRKQEKKKLKEVVLQKRFAG